MASGGTSLLETPPLLIAVVFVFFLVRNHPCINMGNSGHRRLLQVIWCCTGRHTGL